MLAAPANPIPQTAVSVNDKVVYASKNVLVFWDPISQNIEPLGAVDSEITSIVANNETLYVGTSSGKLHQYFNTEFNCLADYNCSITCLAFFSGKLVVGSMDGKIRVLNGEVTDLNVKGYALSITGYDDLLIVGGTKWSITVFNLKTLHSVELEGHENWIRSLCLKPNKDNSLSLASASQDRYIRLWKISKDLSEEDFFSTKVQLDEWKVSFEALLMGHDDWVVSVAWDPYSDALLSASSDSSMIIWLSGDDSGESDLWTPANRFGDLSVWGASTATGTSGGFWCCLWLTNLLLTVSKTGSWRIYQRETWEPVPGPTGHFKDVTDCAWLSDEILLTTSLDQTTRMWAVQNNQIWEIGRPQIHGYDMRAVVKLDDHHFISAGDEKVIRVFEMPQPVAEQVAEITKNSDLVTADLPEVAGVPALGLSNKPETDEIVDIPTHPREDLLQRLTLWPEVEKLYGHGYEISSIAYANNILASVCRANNEKHARIRYFKQGDWFEVPEPTAGHALTVTRLAISPDGSRLLSVSRDRKIMVMDLQTHEVLIDNPKAHSRIIWDGCFFNEKLITGSRDKSVKLWTDKGEFIKERRFPSSVTAVAANTDFVAAGEETGEITILNKDFSIVGKFKTFSKVNRMNFCGSKLAVSSNVVQVFNIS